MVKSYLRYESAAAFGVIASVESNITYDTTGKHLLAPALEKIGVWQVRLGICSKTLTPSTQSRGPSIAVTSIAAAPSPSSKIVSGHADGSIRIWDGERGTCDTTLYGHKGATTVLRFNKTGSYLASGSKDNDIVLWDVVSEEGRFRLRGHRDQVTDLAFLDSGKKLVSASKDKFLRVWDLDTQHCTQIVGGHHSEIWSLDVDPLQRYLVTGSGDSELRFYTIQHDQTVTDVKDSAVENKWESLKLFGEINRQSKDRVATLSFNNTGNLLACQVAGKTVEIYRVLDEAESKRKAKRRINRKKEKKSSKTVDATETENTDHELTVTVSDVFKLLQTLRANKKICSITFSPITSKNSLATLALSLNNNLLEVYSIDSDSTTKTSAIELQGHRSDVRSVTLNSDSTLLMSTSHNSVKIWNPSAGSCIRTIDSGYGLCSLFVPGNKYAVIGTKSGTLEIIDVRSGTTVEVVKAHTGSVQSIVHTPDGGGFVTGSTDHDVKFWEYQTTEASGQDSVHLTVSNVRTLPMNDDVIVVAVSPDGKHIAAALLDCTVKVYYMDTLKFFLTLYGHKLPVLCMDISSDGDLIVTGSADKNIKIWGLDFGDCHKSIFAHADSVTAVKFVRNTHYMFSVGKDRLVKYWDADKFELLLTLEGHHAEVWCLAISHRGDFLVTGSHDRSIRRWDRTEEPFFLEEEKEKRLEEMFEADLDNSLENRYLPQQELPEEGAVAVAGKKTQETLSATDSIIEALDIAAEELKRMAEHEEEKRKGKGAVFQSNIIMTGLSPSDYILRSVSKVHTNDLEQTLLALPFSDALKLLSFLKDWSSNPDKVELVCRIATVLLQVHHNQLIATASTRPLLALLRDILHARVKGCKDTLGFNLAAMDHLKQLMASKSDAPFRDAKTKLLEIRAQQSKRVEGREDTKGEKRRKKKKQKKDDGHVWS
ncbi:putative transcription factor WD40-like family [Helianthus annuus]|uniref:Putative transducin family protein / WD-40 repeat family protein n=1 Tax=Helianthus annuus TaxID=4232 RepID=A0A251SRT8_HELAN|nr:WD repeat-containing protein 3 [Helianthus annuus]KAF5773170.1 putative transcription factor WD40-like family [Helianthus annuus]KAJ0476689.1 putative transcription factor WD40-like family [Helianthus annuus]KAJ0480991.1 putative transcription factor WD40-like family [Helianthus annuus]KAJ0497511.1 putative transcription factor WD40-like family [Helianthus annuus]KAJ0663527.1 putative transcription factor WD40-like family [Helianthus annuus]